jgi:hypothetical protein
MAERGILFSDVMVRAIRAGVKTQTRRLALDRSDRSSLWASLKPGDRLWVREVWAPEAGGGFLYRATGDQALRWRSSIHMPKRAARVWLTVTDVRVESLQAISAVDAKAEGMAIHGRAETPAPTLFEDQWDTLHGDGAWQKNPDVVVISFRVDP